MPVEHRCNFAQSSIPYEEALVRLSRVFEEGSIEFGNSISPITSSLGVDVNSYVVRRVQSCEEAIAVASRWSGVSLWCTYSDVLAACGNALLCELDIYLGRAKRGSLVAFEEHRALNGLRVEQPELETNFYRLLVALCEVLEVAGCVHGNDTTLEDLRVDERVLEDLLARGALPDGSPLETLVFRMTEELWKAKARQARSHGRELLYAPGGYAILKLQAPE